MLGTDLGRAFSAAGLDWVGTDREVDFTDPQAVENFGVGKAIDWVINCAAYTAVDKAEDEPELCRKLNVDGPACLARWASAHRAALVHISTDYVFSGQGTVPYREDDAVAPQGIYGVTKADGERAIRDSCPRHYILRTAWLYGVAGPNFITTMLRLMNSKDSLGVVADQWGAPTWTLDLAAVIVALIQKGGGQWGTYHASGEGQCTWHEFALAILREAQARELVPPTKAVTVNALTTDQYPTKAQRPAWSVLSKDKLDREFGLKMPAWQTGLVGFLDSLTNYSDDRSTLRELAAADHEVMRFLFDSGRYLYAVHYCQQSLEKALKVLAALYRPHRRSHDLVQLAEDAAVALSPEEFKLAEELSGHYLTGRYTESLAGVVDSSEELWLRITKHPAYFL